VFAWHRLEVDAPIERVLEVIRAGPAACIPDLIEDASGRLLCSISVNFGGRLERQAQVGIGELASGDGWLTLPVSWRAAEADVLFPVFTGELQAADLSEGRTELALVGHYDPPLGPVGELVDRLVLHRVARQALAGFLRRVSERVMSGTASATPAAS